MAVGENLTPEKIDMHGAIADRFAVTDAWALGMTQPTMSTKTLKIESRIVRRYEAAARQLRKRGGGALPTVEELIHRELSHRTATGIVEDFLQSDWSPGSPRSQAAIRTLKANRRIS